MNEKTIPLKYSKKDFEEIYFRDNRENLFFSPITKTLTITFITLSIITIIFYFGGFWGIDNWGMLYLLLFFLTINLIRLVIGVLAVLKWRNSIYKYLETMEKYNKIEARVLTDFINVILDDKEDFIHWNEFKRIEMNDNFIALEGKVNYLFPKKSMSEEDYIFFKESLKKILTK
jgi:hypothetical protein